jgi:RluA family pseudouridine synthase
MPRRGGEHEPRSPSPGPAGASGPEGALAAELGPGVEEVSREGALWVLEKPAGVLSHPNPPERRAKNALLQGVYDLRHESYLLPGPGARRVWLVHRLDRDTSGLILCALDAETAARLKEDLRSGRMEKEYQALVLGLPRVLRGVWEDRLVERQGAEKVTVEPRRGAANARAGFRVLRAFRREGLALLALRPETGRTHQLRVQAASRGIPIAGDERYGDFRRNRDLARELGLRRLFLHASRLVVRDPRGGRRLELESPLPAELAGVLERLGARR